MLFEHTKCKKCNHINPLYKSICAECKSYLRERIVNIDLWSTIQLIIEDPNKAFKQIIFSEHKNFIVPIIFFISIKNLLISRYFSVPELGLNGVTTPYILSLSLVIVITLMLTVLSTFLQKSFYGKRAITLRLRDIYAINAYSFIPYLFGLLFVFPVELVVLGGDVFSNNPYSFEIKPLISYILAGFEVVTIIWSFFLIQKSILQISASRIFSIFLTSAYFILWFITLYLSSKFIFSL